MWPRRSILVISDHSTISYMFTLPHTPNGMWQNQILYFNNGFLLVTPPKRSDLSNNQLLSFCSFCLRHPVGCWTALYWYVCSCVILYDGCNKVLWNAVLWPYSVLTPLQLSYLGLYDAVCSLAKLWGLKRITLLWDKSTSQLQLCSNLFWSLT